MSKMHLQGKYGFLYNVTIGRVVRFRQINKKQIEYSPYIYPPLNSFY